MDAQGQRFPLAGRERFKVRAIFVGERLDLRAMETASRLASFPLTFSVRDTGCASLFKFGVIVLFGVDAIDEAHYLETLKPFIAGKYEKPEREELEVCVKSDCEEGVQNDLICIRESSVERIQLIAEIVSKSVVMSYYESKVAKTFDAIEPLAESLRKRGAVGPGARVVLKHIGDVLLSEHTMVGRVEVNEKPELLWDHPELERLYARLAGEYEIDERRLAVERKLNLIARTNETALELLRTRQSHRLEWYIIALILFEIVLSLYEKIAG